MAADLKARPRPVGATAVLGRTGFPHVTSGMDNSNESFLF